MWQATCHGHDVTVLRLPDRRLCAHCGAWIEPGDNCHVVNGNAWLHGLCFWPWIEAAEGVTGKD